MAQANYVMIDGVAYSPKHKKVLGMLKNSGEPSHFTPETGVPFSKGADIPKRIRQSSRPLLNKLEQEWYDRHRDVFGFISIQAIRFKLGNGIWYKPDFVVWGEAGIYGYEIKGPHGFRGGFENLKVAAFLYRKIEWWLTWKENGEWKEQQILP